MKNIEQIDRIMFEIADILRKDIRAKSGNLVENVADGLGEVVGLVGGDNVKVKSARSVNGSVLQLKVDVPADQVNGFVEGVDYAVKSKVKESITDWSKMKKPK